MFFIIWHFFLKAIVSFELVKAISFYILFTFRISAVRLFIFMSFFSLDLYTYQLSINRIITKNFIIFKNGFIVCKMKKLKNGTLCVKVGKIKLFWKHCTKSDRKHLIWSHSWNMWNDVSHNSLYKLQQEPRGGVFIPKVWVFFK